MTRPGSIPPALRASLESPGGRCYRHCDRPIRVHRLASTLPGLWAVRSCPSGVVSVTFYAESGRRDPTPRVLRALRAWTSPASLVRRFDLRLATRHGPELGRAAERFLASHPGRQLRVVYWRVYPFRSRDGSERRLFVCLRRSHRGPRFLVADPAAKGHPCPACAVAPGKPRSRRGRKRPSRG